jgi:stage V sporulation protein B
MLVATLFSSCAGKTIDLLFPADYAKGGGALSVLAYGIVCFSLFLISATAISGSGKPVHSALIALTTLAGSVVLNSVLIPRYELIGAACGTTVAMAFGLCITWIYLLKKFGNCLPLLSSLRIAGVSIVVYVVSVQFPCGGIRLLGKFALLASVYVALLFAVRECGADDVRRVGGMFSRGACRYER